MIEQLQDADLARKPAPCPTCKGDGCSFCSFTGQAEFCGAEPVPKEALCEYCAEGLWEAEVDDSDPSVGYYSTLKLCGVCLSRCKER